MGKEDVIGLSKFDPRRSSLKIVLMGEAKSGKTSFINKLQGKSIDDEYAPTLGSNYYLYKTKIDSLSSSQILVDMWDVSGKDEFQDIATRYTLGSHGLVVIYGADSNDATSQVKNWIDKYLFPYSLTSLKFPIPLVIIQNKTDLVKEKKSLNQQHQNVLSMVTDTYGDRFSIQEHQISSLEENDLKKVMNEFIEFIFSSFDANRSKQKAGSKTSSLIAVSEFCKSTYLLAFHMDYGPVIVDKSDEGEKLAFNQEELSYAVKLYSILDFDDLIKYGFRLGMAPWPMNDSSIYYLAFVVKNGQIRGGYDMFILGATITNELTNFISSYQDKVEGFLVSSMNKLARHLNNFEAELTIYEDTFSVSHNVDDSNLIKEPLVLLRKEINQFLNFALQGIS